MKLQFLIQQLYYEPSLITPEAHASIRQLIESRLGQESILNEDGKREGTYCGEKVELPSMEIVDGIAHIPVAGAIGQKLSGFAKFAGAVDVQDIEEEIEMAESDRKVRAILFDMDTPGGMVSGTPELADRIAAIRKPNYAFSNGLIASAGYWLASACNGIFCTRTSSIGSIGVYLPVYDYSEYYKMEGVKVELIKAGKLKGLGYPGTQLSDAGREHLQERINKIYGMFTGHVRSMRGDISSDTMQGQVFLGSEAFERGLVDGLVRSKADVVSML